jgi:broad specificity phosphatase PhoE
MDTTVVSSSGRPRRRTVTALAALATSAVLAGCGASTVTPTPAPTTHAPPSAVATRPPTPDRVAAPTVVMVIRHGEKPEDDSTPGFDANGTQDESSLTTVGWDRAHRLADLFDPTQGAVRSGLARPKAIYAAGANEEGEGQRTRETVKPLADRLGIPVNISYGKGDIESLVQHVLTQPGPTLISWQHSDIPSIAEAFPSVTPTPPSEWPDDRFDVVWTFTKTANGWHFAQLPELVLPQDQASPIEDD